MKRLIAAIALLCWLATAPAYATPGLGQFASNANASGTTVTTAGVATTASSSTFYIVCIANTSGNFSLATDSKLNVYTQIGTTFTDGTTNNKMARYKVTNGTGGSAHTGTCTTTVSGPNTIFFNEVTGVDTTNSLDIAATPAVDASAPYQSPSTGTLNHANEIIFSFAEDNSSSVGDTWTASGGFTLITDSVTDGQNLVTAAMSYVIVSATTAQQATWSSTQGTSFGIGIDSFFGAGGGGGGTPPGLAAVGAGK